MTHPTEAQANKVNETTTFISGSSCGTQSTIYEWTWFTSQHKNTWGVQSKMLRTSSGGKQSGNVCPGTEQKTQYTLTAFEREMKALFASRRIYWEWGRFLPRRRADPCTMMDVRERPLARTKQTYGGCNHVVRK